MKFKKLILTFIFITILSTYTLPIFAQSVESLNSESAVLLDADTGQVLYNKNMNEKKYPASITKIMTGLLAAEHLEAEANITTSKSALNISPQSTTMGLTVGEIVTVEQALYGLMLLSGNDAANVLGEQVSGSQEEFVKLMNEKAKELGAHNTNFTNTHGLPDNNHYTTAYDMALIAQAAAKNEKFMKYFGAKSYTMGHTNKKSYSREFTNFHGMLSEDNILCGKTGYTNAAGNTLVTVSQRDGRKLVSVVLKASADGKYGDTRKLFNYGFDNFNNFSIETKVKKDEVSKVAILNDNGEAVADLLIDVPDVVDITLNSGENVETVETEVIYGNALEENAEVFLNVYIPENNNTSKRLVKQFPLDYTVESIPLITALKPPVANNPLDQSLLVDGSKDLLVDGTKNNENIITNEEATINEAENSNEDDVLSDKNNIISDTDNNSINNEIAKNDTSDNTKEDITNNSQQSDNVIVEDNNKIIEEKSNVIDQKSQDNAVIAKDGNVNNKGVKSLLLFAKQMLCLFLFVMLISLLQIFYKNEKVITFIK